jgi:hypothetical protein
MDEHLGALVTFKHGGSATSDEPEANLVSLGTAHESSRPPCMTLSSPS